MSKTGLLRVQFSIFSFLSLLFKFIHVREHRKRCPCRITTDSFTSSLLFEGYVGEKKTNKRTNKQEFLNDVLVDFK